MGVERPRELETVATHREREAVSVEGRMPETSSGTGWNVFDLDGRTVEADSRRLQVSAFASRVRLALRGQNSRPHPSMGAFRSKHLHNGYHAKVYRCFVGVGM
ncbi:hypothetical protein CH368_17230 [Leptospira levettii]|nr:hypothetical protein CH368_17230 [Leptospira levettii]